MATDGPTPAPCERDIFENGTCVLVTAEVSSNRMERWVKKVAERSGQRVDWHFAGGWARVLTLGDPGAVREACLSLREELDALYQETNETALSNARYPSYRAPWRMPKNE